MKESRFTHWHAISAEDSFLIKVFQFYANTYRVWVETDISLSGLVVRGLICLGRSGLERRFSPGVPNAREVIQPGTLFAQ